MACYAQPTIGLPFESEDRQYGKSRIIRLLQHQGNHARTIAVRTIEEVYEKTDVA